MATLPNGYTNFVSPVKYFIDGKNIFSEYGVAVSNSRGIISAPAIKETLSYSWQDRHGEVIDTSKVLYEAKHFSLDCWMIGTSNLDITEKLNNLYTILTKPGLRRVMLWLDNLKPLIFQVVISGSIEVTKKWTNNSLIHADFTISFKEPEPMKMILFGTVADGISLEILISCSKPLNIRWGQSILGSDMIDGNYADSIDVVGDDISLQQYYSVDSAKCYPIITGDLTSIKDLQLTGLSTLWSKLI